MLKSRTRGSAWDPRYLDLPALRPVFGPGIVPLPSLIGRRSPVRSIACESADRQSQRDALISRLVIRNHGIQLVLSSVSVERENMKTQKLIDTNLISRLLIVPVICSLAFAACSDAGDMAGTHATVNLQNAATGDDLTIDPRTSAPRVLMTRIGR